MALTQMNIYNKDKVKQIPTTMGAQLQSRFKVLIFKSAVESTESLNGPLYTFMNTKL